MVHLAQDLPACASVFTVSGSNMHRSAKEGHLSCPLPSGIAAAVAVGPAAVKDGATRTSVFSRARLVPPLPLFPQMSPLGWME